MRRISGIYVIFMNDEALYVGQSVNCNHRITSHFNHLKNNKHHNGFLQRVYNKQPDKSCFSFDIIDEVEENNLGEMEQYWMNMISPKCNIMPGGGITSLEWRKYLSKKYTGKPNYKIRGRKLNKEQVLKRQESRRKNGWFIDLEKTKQKMSKSHKETKENAGRFKKGVGTRLGTKASPETIEKLRKSHLGHKVTDETKEKLRKAFSGKKQPQWVVDKRAAAIRESYAKKRLLLNTTK